MIERCWGILEQHWNGTQLKTIEDAVQWASSLTASRPSLFAQENEVQWASSLTASRPSLFAQENEECLA